MTDHDNSTFVIAVSGVSGAGKSTLCHKIAAALGDAAVIHFDDYHRVSTYPDDLWKWVHDGADPNEWSTPQFAQALCSLRNGQEVMLPETGEVVKPNRFIVVEEPFGKARDEMRPSLDFAAHINVPLDIALIRIINRMLTDDAVDADPLGAPLILSSLFNLYLEEGLRGLFVDINSEVPQTADVVLDGTLAADELARQVVEAVRHHS